MKRTQKMVIPFFGLMGILAGFLIGAKPQLQAETCHQENSVAIKCTACLAPGPGQTRCGDAEGETYGCVT